MMPSLCLHRRVVAVTEPHALSYQRLALALESAGRSAEARREATAREHPATKPRAPPTAPSVAAAHPPPRTLAPLSAENRRRRR